MGGGAQTMRLEQEPKARPRTLRELMSIAAAMESEAVRRYGELAAEMSRRGDLGLAAAFQAMLEEERDHLEGVARWSHELTGLPPGEAAEPWHLPPEIAHSWDEVAQSALLTPYGALSIAVLNEERGFAFYSYLAAHAEDRGVRDAAERLAAEELNHAAVLRRERRRAYRRERAGKEESRREPPLTAPEFTERAQRIEREAAAAHASIAADLAVLGETADAAALAAIADAESKAAASPSTIEAKSASDASLSRKGRLELLRAALAEAERLYDFYADLADHAGAESVLRAAQGGAARAVHHLGLIAARLHAPAPDAGG
jgi:rubrerythrin